jgi:hypothetical protein
LLASTCRRVTRLSASLVIVVVTGVPPVHAVARPWMDCVARSR